MPPKIAHPRVDSADDPPAKRTKSSVPKPTPVASAQTPTAPTRSGRTRPAPPRIAIRGSRRLRSAAPDAQSPLQALATPKRAPRKAKAIPKDPDVDMEEEDDKDDDNVEMPDAADLSAKDNDDEMSEDEDVTAKENDDQMSEGEDNVEMSEGGDLSANENEETTNENQNAMPARTLYTSENQLSVPSRRRIPLKRHNPSQLRAYVKRLEDDLQDSFVRRQVLQDENTKLKNENNFLKGTINSLQDANDVLVGREVTRKVLDAQRIQLESNQAEAQAHTAQTTPTTKRPASCISNDSVDESELRSYPRLKIHDERYDQRNATNTSFPTANGAYFMSGALDPSFDNHGGNNSHAPPHTPSYTTWMNPVASVKRIFQSNTTPGTISGETAIKAAQTIPGSFPSDESVMDEAQAPPESFLPHIETAVTGAQSLPGSFLPVDVSRATAAQPLPAPVPATPLQTRNQDIPKHSFMSQTTPHYHRAETTSEQSQQHTKPVAAKEAKSKGLMTDEEILTALRAGREEEAQKRPVYEIKGFGDRSLAGEDSLQHKKSPSQVTSNSATDKIFHSPMVKFMKLRHEFSGDYYSGAGGAGSMYEPAADDAADPIAYGQEHGFWTGPKGTGQFAVPEGDSSSEEEEEEYSPPQPAATPSAKDTEALARARSQAEKYKPKTPSTLRANSAATSPLSAPGNAPDRAANVEKSGENAGAAGVGLAPASAPTAVTDLANTGDSVERYSVWPPCRPAPWAHLLDEEVQAALDATTHGPAWDAYCSQVWKQAMAAYERGEVETAVEGGEV